MSEGHESGLEHGKRITVSFGPYRLRLTLSKEATMECPDCGAPMHVVDPAHTPGTVAWECPSCCKSIREGTWEHAQMEVQG